MLRAWDVITAAENSGTVGAVGLLVTVLAFGLTIWQLVRTQRAVQAVADEMDSFRVRLKADEATRIVSGARDRIKLAIQQIKSSSDDRVFDTLQDLREGLLRLTSFDEVVGDRKLNLSTHQKRISDYITSYEGMRRAAPEGDKSKMIGGLRSLSELVSEIEGRTLDQRK